MKSRSTVFLAALGLLIVGIIGAQPSMGGEQEGCTWQVGPDPGTGDFTWRLLPQADPGRGGGGTVSNLLAVQVGYIDEDAVNGTFVNVILLPWVNTGPNPDGISLYYDGIFITTIEGHLTSTFLYGNENSGGPTTFSVEGAGTTASDELDVLGSQPFDDPEGLSCRSGPRDPQSGSCSMTLTIPGLRRPQFYFVAVNDIERNETIPGSRAQWTLPDVPAGNPCATLLGAISTGGNDYLGDAVTTCCPIACVDLPCDAPYNLTLCQSRFGAGPTDNAVRLGWKNGELSYASLLLSLDGGAAETLGGTSVEAEIGNLAPGEHRVSLVGDCGANGMSEPLEATFTVKAGLEQAKPIEDLTCRFTVPGGGTLVANWKNLVRGTSIDVYLIDPSDTARLVATLSGQATGVTVNESRSTDRIGVRVLVEVTETGGDLGTCAASELIICTPDPPPGFKFLRGDCDASSNMDLTDAIFLLNHLFKGGEASRCQAGCDANLDDLINLTDAVYLLNHLFKGGTPPAGQFPLCDESRPEESCTLTTCTRT